MSKSNEKSHLRHADGLVDAGAVDVFAQQVVVALAILVIAVVFGYHVVAVIEVLCGVAVDVFFAAPAVGGSFRRYDQVDVNQKITILMPGRGFLASSFG